MSIRDKIDFIVEREVVPRWQMPSHTPELILYAFAHYYLIAKNGKKCFASAYARTVLTVSEQEQNYLKVQDLKYHKMRNARKSLKDFIESQFEKRAGLLGYRGYFTFVDILEYEY